VTSKTQLPHYSFPPPLEKKKKKDRKRKEKTNSSWVAKLQLIKPRKGHPEKPITINAKTKKKQKTKNVQNMRKRTHHQMQSKTHFQKMEMLIRMKPRKQNTKKQKT
jgi:hypothetical protein